MFLSLSLNPDKSLLDSYALALAICTPIFVFAEMGMRTIFMTQNNKIHFMRFVELRLVTLVFAALALLIWALATADQNLFIFLIVIFIKMIDLIADLFSAPLVLRLETRFFATWSIFSNSFAAVAALTLALNGKDGGTVMLNFALIQLIALPFLLFSKVLREYFSSKSKVNELDTKTKEWAKIIGYGIQAGSSNLLLTLVITFPQYVLAMQGQTSSLPFLALILYFPAMIDMFFGAVSQSWIPSANLIVDKADQSKSAIKMSKKWALQSAIFMFFGALISPIIAGLVVQHKFVFDLSISTPLFITALVTPFIYFGSLALYLNQKFASSAIMGLISAGVSLALAISLVPYFGISGAAWAICGASIMRAILPFLVLRRKSAI